MKGSGKNDENLGAMYEGGRRIYIMCVSPICVMHLSHFIQIRFVLCASKGGRTTKRIQDVFLLIYLTYKGGRIVKKIMIK